MSADRLILCALLLVASRAAQADYPDEVGHDNPAGYWRFDDPSSEPGATAATEIGKHPAEFRGGVELADGVPGIGGKAAHFLRAGSHVLVPAHPDFDTDNVSVEFWFSSTQSFPDHYWPGSATFVSKGTPDNGSSDWTLIAGCAPDGSQGRVIAGAGPRPGTDLKLYSSVALNDGQWHHIVWTRANTGENRLYVDGQSVAAANDGGGAVRNHRPITVGSDPILGGRDLRGRIDELALYSTVLPADRVQAHFQAAGTKGSTLFAQHIAVLLESRCLKCHSGKEAKGALDLTTRERLLVGGESGAAIEPHNSRASLLVRLIAHEEEPEMPAGEQRLSAETVARVAEWIDAGAPYTRTLRPSGGAGRDFWSFQPLSDVPLPEVRRQDWARGPLDRFVLSALEANAASPAPEADRRTLIRRLYFDLIGLPPEPQAVDSFVADARPDAYEHCVDALLASPHYGERWGRHWLDLARYADSAGYERDADRITSYYYRDFVVRALNDDMPYDQFVRWQIAGDELAPDDPSAQAATGFLAVGPVLHSKEGTPAEFEQYRYDELDDLVSTMGSAMLGLTIGCARCHDHKFDPISTRDYYRLVATFATTHRVHAAASQSQTLTLADVEKSKQPGSRLFVTDRQAEPVPAFLLSRGDPQKKLEPITAGFLSVLTPGGDGRPKDSKPASGTTGQRRALAEWLTDVEHGAGGLAARVIINRLWQHHFGAGIVRTPDDFGMQGERPVDPALLDHLASDLIRSGWRLKGMHRQIVCSAAYRQQVTSAQAVAEIAPAARFYYRRPLRLEAEIIRDAILATSGQLNREVYGPSIKPYLPPEAQSGRSKDNLLRPEADGPDQWRRSIYLFVKRSLTIPLLESFDAPGPNSSCGRRTQSTVPTQALALLNDPFVRTQARAFAERCRASSSADPASQVERAYRVALGRSPTDTEREASLRFLSAQADDTGLVNLCHVLVTLNEFVYLD